MITYTNRRYKDSYFKRITNKYRSKVKDAKKNRKFKRPGNTFKVPKSFLLELFEFDIIRCACCKGDMAFTELNHFNQATIDRIDCRLPYTLNNIILLCKRCNDSKDSIGKDHKPIYEWNANFIITNQINNMF